MYQYTTHSFGKFEAYTFENPISKQKMVIIPAYGGVINELHLTSPKGTQNIINGCVNENELLTSPFFKGHWLLPFPNRLQDGQFTFEGQVYQFPINEEHNHNNLHGFTHIPEFTIDAIQLQSSKVIVTMSTAYHATYEYYPFSFDFEVQLTLEDGGNFEIQITIKNIGATNLPVGMGWHPYFKLDDTTINELALQLPQVHKIQCNQWAIPVGQERKYALFEKSAQLNNTHFDTCFRILNTNSKVPIHIKSELHQLTIWQNTKHFPFTQIYTPDDRQSIAIEPMTCNIDAFNNQDGLLIISPDKEVVLDFGIQLQAIQNS